jgi:hypothetical protein
VKDYQIRQLLRRTELLKYIVDNDSKVVEELGISVANARIDIAVINGAFHGYEIKGSSDTLQRLPNQLIAYTYVFDYLTIITEEKHHQKVIDLVPEWVAVATCSKGSDHLEIKQKGSKNNFKNGFHLAQLLWREELLQVLQEYNIQHKKKYRNWILCEILSTHFDVNSLSDIVRTILKNRQNWKTKVGCEAMSNDGFDYSEPKS